MTPQIPPPALRVTRLPGEYGPILRCDGELSVATAEILRRELADLEPMGHPALTLDLADCDFLDVEGMVVVLHAFRQWRRHGRRMAVVGGTRAVSRLLQVTGIDRIIPTFPTEETATRALRGGGPAEPAPATWAEARDRTVARWRAIQQSLDETPSDELLRQLTSMFALCERAEEIFQDRTTPAVARSALEPIIAAVRAGDRNEARARVARMIQTLEEMPLPEESRSAPREVMSS
jgi:anti-sigma B factor antagonist